MKDRHTWLIIGVVAILLLFGMGTSFPLAVLGQSLFGWSGIAVDSGPRISVSGPNLLLCSFAIMAFFVGGHWFLCWLCKSYSAQTTPTLPVGEAAVTTRQWRLRWTTQTFVMLVAILTAGLSLLGVARHLNWMPTSELLSDASKQASLSNLTRQGQAFQNFAGVNKHLPPGFTAALDGRVLHSWQTQLLPYIDQAQLAQRIDLTAPWNAPRNAPHCNKVIEAYLNPSTSRNTIDHVDGFATSHYAGNRLLLGDLRGHSYREIIDGARFTVLAGEAAGNFTPWAKPTRGRDFTLGLDQSADGFGGNRQDHTTIVLMADGSAHVLSDDVDPRVLKALATPSGRDDF